VDVKLIQTTPYYSKKRRGGRVNYYSKKEGGGLFRNCQLSRWEGTGFFGEGQQKRHQRCGVFYWWVACEAAK